MSTKLKIGIVEDEMLIAEKISVILKQLGYEVTTPAITFTEAVEMIENEKPDLLLLDINLSGAKDGIDLAWKIKEDFGLPFIFLTANSDASTIERAKKVNPPSYLVKPFGKDDLFTSIEIAFHNHTQNKNIKGADEVKYFVKDALFIKDGYYFHKVFFYDVLYLESNNNYVTVHTKEKKHIVRNSLQQYMEHFDSTTFFRVHRSFVVNLHHVTIINTDTIKIGEHSIPLSRTFREDLLSKIKLG